MRGKVVVSSVGFLMGDAWTHLPGVVGLCRDHDVSLVSGSYSLPVWQWAKRYVQGADYKIVRMIEAPDVVEHPYCPGKGFLAITPATDFVKSEYPADEVIHCGQCEGYTQKLEVHGGTVDVMDGDYTVVHPYTRHDWKNCRMVVRDVTYSRPVKAVGLPGEYEPGPGWEMLPNQGFEAMVNAVLGSAGFVGVLSSFTNVATLFGKKQIIVSFTPDMPQVNERAVKLVAQSVEELQRAVTEMGL